MDHREASHPPAKFATSPNSVLITRTEWYVVVLNPRSLSIDSLNNAMPEYTSPNTELDSPNVQNAGLNSACRIVISASCEGDSSWSPSRCKPLSSGLLRMTIAASGASANRRNQPTPAHAGRQ